MAESLHGVQAGGAAGGQVAGRQGDPEQEDGHAGEGRRVGGFHVKQEAISQCKTLKISYLRPLPKRHSQRRQKGWKGPFLSLLRVVRPKCRFLPPRLIDLMNLVYFVDYRAGEGY